MDLADVEDEIGESAVNKRLEEAKEVVEQNKEKVMMREKQRVREEKRTEKIKEREKNANFTDGYYEAIQSIVVAKPAA